MITHHMRVDKYLWAIRLFKTRTLAAKQCEAGKVKRAGKSLKPSSSLKPDDILVVPAADDTHKRTIKVIELIEKRVSSPIAQAAYDDITPEDILKEAAEKRAIHREERDLRQQGDQGRMTKRQRRIWQKQIHGFKDES